MTCKDCGNAVICIEKGGLDYMRCTGCGQGWYAGRGELAA